MIHQLKVKLQKRLDSMYIYTYIYRERERKSNNLFHVRIYV